MDASSPVLREALRLAASGRAVFPCKPNKAPYTRNGFKDGSTQPEAVVSMFTKWEDACLGMATGSGLIVIDTDLDPSKGKDGEAGLASLPPLPPTYTVKTPRGGRHRWYKTPDGVVLPNSSDKLASGIDIRGDGGYVVTAPSVTERGHYQVIDGREIATLPDSWVDLILPSEKPALEARQTLPSKPAIKTERVNLSHEADLTPWEDYKQRTTWAEILMAAGWQRGKTSGDNTHWTRPGKDGGTSATTNGEDGAFYVFSTSTEFEANKAYGKSYVYAALYHGGDLRAAGRALRLKGFGSRSDWQPAKRERSELDEALGVEEVAETEQTPEAKPEQYWTISSLRDYVVDPSHFLVGDGWMRRGAVSLLVGMTGIGKSVLAVQMAACMATGRNILDKLEVKAPLKVAVIQAENDPDTMKRDLCAVTDALNLDEDLLDANLRMYHKPGMTPMMLATMLCAIHEEWPFDVVVIDNYMSYCGGDINATETFFEFRNAVEPPLNSLGVGCLLLTHPPKPMRGEAPTRHAREVVYNAAGTSALANWVRTSCELALAGQEDQRCILRFAKNAERTGLRDEVSGHITRKIYLERSDYVRPYWRVADNQGEASQSQYEERMEVIWMADPTITIRDLADKVACGKSTAERFLARKRRLAGDQPATDRE